MFRHALEQPLKYFERIQTDGERPVLGFFTDLVPVELVHAAKMHAGRLYPSRTSDQPLDSFVQIFCCSYLRNILSQFIEHHDINKALSAVLFTENFCDSMQNVSDIFQHAFSDFPILFLRQPVSTIDQYATPFFIAELQKLSKMLGKITGASPDEKRIKSSIELYTDVRKLLSEIESVHLANPSQIRFSDMIACIAGKDLFLLEDYQQYLSNILEEWQAQKKPEEVEKPRILVVGGMFHDLNVFDTIEEVGSLIVGELLSFGHNDYKMQFNHSLNSYSALGKAYLSKIPSSTRYDLYNKRESLLKLVQERKIDGVIHLNWQFCDPDAFERVMFKETLERERIPNLIIETDPLLSNLEQLRTRIQAFVELLE